MSTVERDRQMKAVMDGLTVSEKGPPSPRQVQLLNYVSNISSHPDLANALVNQGLLTVLARQVRDAQLIDVYVGHHYTHTQTYMRSILYIYVCI